MKLPITDQETILAFLPQKPPFVMVDSLHEIDENKAVSGLTILSENLLCEESFFSEAGLVENMAQTIALHGGYQGFLKGKALPETGFLGAIKSLEVFGLPKSGTRIKTRIEILHDIMGICLSEAETRNEAGKLLARASLKTIKKQNSDW